MLRFNVVTWQLIKSIENEQQTLECEAERGGAEKAPIAIATTFSVLS